MDAAIWCPMIDTNRYPTRIAPCRGYPARLKITYLDWSRASARDPSRHESGLGHTRLSEPIPRTLIAEMSMPKPEPQRWQATRPDTVRRDRLGWRGSDPKSDSAQQRTRQRQVLDRFRFGVGQVRTMRPGITKASHRPSE